MKNILIIEDDKAITRLLNLAIKTNDMKPLIAENAVNGISMFLSHAPDLILLDLGLPDIDGLEVLKQIREISSVPIIIVSARGREKEKILALDNGADDYVTKPFSIAELLARIRVALRKTNIKEITTEFVFNDLVINYDKHKVKIDEREIHLTPIEFKLLKLLTENQGKVLTHSFIQKHVWGYESNDEYQSLRVFMTTLRRKIEKDTSNPKYILTEIGVGYRFCDD